LKKAVELGKEKKSPGERRLGREGSHSPGLLETLVIIQQQASM
jgi:hypothetical protein